MNDKRGSQSLMHLDSRKRSPTRRIARAVANGCRSSEDGEVVDEVVVVRITSFAVVESICKLHLRISTSTAEIIPLRPEYSKEPTGHAADTIIGRSLALPVHLSTTSPPTPALHTRACLTTVFQPMAPLPHYAQLNKLCRHFARRSHGSRFKSISSPHFTECTCPVTLGLSNFRLFVLAIPS